MKSIKLFFSEINLQPESNPTLSGVEERSHEGSGLAPEIQGTVRLDILGYCNEEGRSESVTRISFLITVSQCGIQLFSLVILDILGLS